MTTPEATPRTENIVRLPGTEYDRLRRIETAARVVVASAEAHEVGLASDESINALRAALDEESQP